MRIFFLLAGASVFAYLFVQLGPAAVLSMLGRIGWGAVVILATYAVYQSFRALALVAAITPSRTIRFADALWIRLSGEAVQFLTFTGPFLAEPAKALLLKRRGLTTREGFAATITEYLAYTITASVLSIGAFWWVLEYGSVSGATRTAAIVLLAIMGGFFATSTVAIATRTKLLGAILQWASGLPLLRRKLRPNMANVHRVEELMLEVMHDRPARFARLLVLETTAHGLHILELYVILLTLELHAGFGTAMLIEGAAKFIGLAFFFIPGQVGASEGAHTLIFEAVGLPAVAGFTVPFVRRIRNILVAAAGLMAVSALTRRQR
jgi:hypothetical protein